MQVCVSILTSVGQQIQQGQFQIDCAIHVFSKDLRSWLSCHLNLPLPFHKIFSKAYNTHCLLRRVANSTTPSVWRTADILFLSVWKYIYVPVQSISSEQLAISCISMSRSVEQQFQKRGPDIAVTGQLRRVPRHSLASWEIQSLHVLLHVYLKVGHAWNTSTGRRPGAILARCHFSWFLLA